MPKFDEKFIVIPTSRTSRNTIPAENSTEVTPKNGARKTIQNNNFIP